MHEYTSRKLVQWIAAIALDKDIDTKEHRTLRV